MNIFETTTDKIRLILEQVDVDSTPKKLKHLTYLLTLQTYINDDHEQRGYINEQFAKDLINNEFKRKVKNGSQ